MCSVSVISSVPMLFHNNIKNRAVITGFTLVELIVVVGIITVISAVVFQNGNKFNDSIALQAVAQDVSLAARQAQEYGVSVKDATGTGSFTSGYGVAFSIANPTYVIVYADANANDIYDSNGDTACDGTNECTDKLLLRNGVVISSICGINTTNNVICSRTYQTIQATFLRPSLNADIVITNGSGQIQPGSWQAAQIILKSPGGSTKTVLISSTGVISVQ
jgi:prepilin-type N-terminal cleavage/methylation domain-containing protein